MIVLAYYKSELSRATILMFAGLIAELAEPHNYTK